MASVRSLAVVSFLLPDSARHVNPGWARRLGFGQPELLVERVKAEGFDGFRPRCFHPIECVNADGAIQQRSFLPRPLRLDRI